MTVQQQVASHVINVTCQNGVLQVDKKTLGVSVSQGAAVINWIADPSVDKILAVAFVTQSQTEFILLRRLNDKHWQCLDRCTAANATPYEYVLIAQCEEGGEPKVADPYIQNQP